MTTSYEEARAAVFRAVLTAEEWEKSSASISVETLRALLSGPPEPTEDGVARVIDGFQIVTWDIALERARAVQALYRSRRNG